MDRREPSLPVRVGPVLGARNLGAAEERAHDPLPGSGGRTPSHAMGQPGGGSGFSLRATGVPQALRLAGCALRIAGRHAGGALGDRLRPRKVRPTRRRRRAERSAELVTRTLGELRGPFVKAAQFASLRYDTVPPPLRERLATLRDRVAPLGLERIRAVVEAELGAPLEVRFARFDPEPLGAASLAQAHRARLPDGREVVVKVQYPWLARSLPTDLALLRLVLRIAAGRRRNHFDGARLFEEFASGMREELDFLHEARVAEEIAGNLADDPQVVVPEVVPSHTTRRVLTMSHHPAVSVTDPAALRRLGVDPREVLEILARAYTRQIFGDGLFHADPHPGNLYVVDEPGAREHPRVLFVDFGLSRRLDPALRRELRRGILAMLGGDVERFLEGMERLGMVAPDAASRVRQAVREMFGRIRAEAGAPLQLPGERVLALKDEAKRLLEETPGLQLPNDLLLYAKTLSYLFGLGREIAPEVDLMRASAPALLRFLAQPE
jgi:predicted unusual protein kinase regulating ubiquinone biosynthesis (AarF/ABC1/UbiB family)